MIARYAVHLKQPIRILDHWPINVLGARMTLEADGDMLPAVHVTIWAILLHFKSFIFSMLVKSSARKLFAEFIFQSLECHQTNNGCIPALRLRLMVTAR